MDYEKTHGKRIDPRSFKKDILVDLSSAVNKAEQKAKRWLGQANIEVDSCYICGSKEKSEVVIEVYGFQYVRCLNCTHVYQTKRLSQDTLVKIYDEDSAYARTYTDKSQIKYRLENIAKPHVDYIMRYVEKVNGIAKRIIP